jgi:hypothetical protein
LAEGGISEKRNPRIQQEATVFGYGIIGTIIIILLIVWLVRRM